MAEEKAKVSTNKAKKVVAPKKIYGKESVKSTRGTLDKI